MKQSKLAQTNKVLLHWFSAMRADRPDLLISGELLRLQATKFARDLSKVAQDEEVDINWLSRWKTDQEVAFKRIAGESVSVSV